MRIGQVMAFVNLPRLVQFRTPTAGYQALRESEMREDVETAHRPLTPAVQSLAGSIQWAPMCRLSAFYAISFLCNALLVLLGCAGWQISSDRDSNQTTKNTSRFISATAYSVPALATSGLLLFWLHRQSSSYQRIESTLHVKLFLFTAASNALAAIFMIIFTMIFDDPETRFGSGDDCRNALIPMIIVLHIVSFSSALSAVYVLLRGPKTISSFSDNSVDLQTRVLPRGPKTPLKVTIPYDDVSSSSSKLQP
ncbi:hypothetical protein D9619_010216 [Psilocybe cf. subviscida]|uniref:Uncharacterized protein n=1 Tax=Psilocybe cf. subviscida TaxID=2480587 RepID=A0A8H5ASH0_9AGAR|nr:hypothetical protein D9619_010216 [Psilocybe cf. subviscida]